MKKILLFLILSFLFVPLIQNTTHFKKFTPPLKGAYIQVKDTAFNVQGWFNENYQKQKNDYVNQNFGLHDYFVLLNNQIDYSLFSKTNVEDVVLGKLGILFEKPYIDAYYGKNFAGEKNLENTILKLKKAQDLLKSNGTDLEIIFLPGKASFFSEYIPDRYKNFPKTSNYTFMSSYAKKINLDFIDFNNWFLQLKKKSPYDLYPSGGIHWSNYGSLLAIDSLRKHIESKTQISMRTFFIDNIHFSRKLIDPDNDIGEALNLWVDPEQLSMPYADYKWMDSGAEQKPTALFVGDSYFWNWYYQGLINNLFSNAKFWYYNQTVFPETEKQREVKNLSFREEISKAKIIVLMATESNIHDIGWGFADMVNNSFKNNAESSLNQLKAPSPMTPRKIIYINYFKEVIANTPEWLEKVKQKAKEKNISLAQMVEIDANYLYDTEYLIPEVLEYTEQTKQRIKRDEKWMKGIKAKAKEKKISTEEMLELDAKYIYDTEVKGKK